MIFCLFNTLKTKFSSLDNIPDNINVLIARINRINRMHRLRRANEIRIGEQELREEEERHIQQAIELSFQD